MANQQKAINTLILVAALGYFVDIYDLILFSVVRKPSLEALGLHGEELTTQGVHLLNMQMIGMLIGGILWGVLGDKKGRVSVLFGSILMYSLANILNGFVTSVESYGWLRLFAGIGLAGELGAGITLVSESMSKEKRGYGTMIIVSVGVCGAVLAGMVGRYCDWKTAYFIGGGLGLSLLMMRIGVYESGMFKHMSESHVSKGNLLILFNNRKRFFKYLNCIIIGLPIWYSIGVLVTLAPEFALSMGITEKISGGDAVMYFYGGTAIGDFMSGYLSQLFKNRKQVLTVYLGIMLLSIPLYLYCNSYTMFYLICVILGFAAGYWAVFITIASEQFGTNIRATATTTVPNFVRGGLVLLSASFAYAKTQLGMIQGAMIVGVIVIILAYISLLNLEETYGKDLDYIE